jgi:phenylalanyl-tRNA synthetase beta chain
MKFTLAWLKDHLKTEASLDAIVDRLTMIGLEVERVEDRASELGAFRVAAVLSAKRHPRADKLQVCMVDAGIGAPIQVVCGAPNARAGLKGVFAPPGTRIPGTGLELDVRPILGIQSHGMLLSARELGLSDEHEGIIALDPATSIGEPVASVLGLDDPVIEINLTPNRPDCAGVHGIARDLAAADLGTFKDPSITPVKGAFSCPVKVTREFGATPSLCPGFALRLMRGVTNGSSPDWLARRLTAIGLRPINALVDITNFLAFDRARPLHVFDADQVRGNLVVRRARAGERLAALDGRTYELDASMCVIADEARVVSLAGIMGGAATGCSSTTTNVLIESALWEPGNIAQTGRKLGLHSDARYRFERGVDSAFMVPGLELATAMALAHCGGQASERVVVGDAFGEDRVIDFPLSELKRLTGLSAPLPEIRGVLNRLGFFVAGQGEQLKIAVPSWRPDIEGKADIVEEIVRMLGVERVPSTPFDRGASARRRVLTTDQIRTRKAKRALAARGLAEAMTWSFVAPGQAALFGGGAPELTLANPISADLAIMRPSLVPGLVAAVQRNADRGFADIGLFEVGQVFAGDRPQDQFTTAAAVRRGRARPTGIGRHWSQPQPQTDIFDAKGDALAALAAAGAPMHGVQVVPGGPPWFHPGRVGTLQVGPQTVLGHFGELHPKTLDALGVEGPLVGFEITLERIPEPKRKPGRMKGPLVLSPFQPITRDFAFLVDRAVSAGDIVRAAQSADRRLIVAVQVFDVYEGEGVSPDRKSIAIAVTLQPRDKTLTDAQIDAVSSRITEEVAKRTGGVLRAAGGSKPA